jgi:hypothetical protein
MKGEEMKTYQLLIILMALWALTNLWLLPLVKLRWKAADLQQKMAQSGILVVLEKVRDLSAMGTIVIALIMLFVWGTAALSTASFALPKDLIVGLSSLYTVAKKYAENYATTLGLVSLIGAVLTLYLSGRYAKRRISDAWITKANEVQARLLRNPSEIEEAQQDPELKHIADRIEWLLTMLDQHTQNNPDPSGSAQELQQEIFASLNQLAIKKAQREVDFDVAISSPSEDEEKAVRASLSLRLIRALTGERFCKDLGLVKKPLSYAVTALLFVSLIGWTSEPLADSLQLAVNNLRINVVNRDAGHELNVVLSQALPSAEKQQQKPLQPNAENTSPPSIALAQTASRQLAHAVVRKIIRSDTPNGLAPGGKRLPDEAGFVRAAILEWRPDPREATDSQSRIRKEVVEKISQTPHGTTGVERLQSHVEQELSPYIARLQEESPSSFQKLVAKVETRYNTPLTPLDAQGNILSQVIDKAFGAIDVHPDSEIGKQSQKILGEFGKEAVKTWTKAYAKTYLINLITEAARPDVVGEFQFETSKEVEQLIQKLPKTAESRNWIKTRREEEETRLSQAVANKLIQIHEQKAEQRISKLRSAASHNEKAAAELSSLQRRADERRAAITESMSGYDHVFPQSGGGGGGNLKTSYHGERGIAYKQSRATNFRLASRSFRVRGVLFGQDLPSKDLEIDDIRWTFLSTGASGVQRVVLEILLGDKWMSLEDFDAAVVNQALRYAADGRVIATTITPGDGDIMGRVTYLHPALIDTPLGCRVVEADRFVDAFTGSKRYEPVDPRLTQVADDRQQVSNWMRTVRLAEMVAGIPERMVCKPEELEKEISELENAISIVGGAQYEYRPVKFSPAVESTFMRFMTTEEKNSTEAIRFLRSAHACATGERDKLASCLCNKVKLGSLTGEYWYPVDHTSQFREKEETLDSSLKWLKRSPDRLGHIDLWVHTTLAKKKATTGLMKITLQR